MVVFHLRIPYWNSITTYQSIHLSLKGKYIMENKVQALVYGVSFSSVEGKEYCSVFLGQSPADPKKYKGIEIMQLASVPEVFHGCNVAQFPAVCTLTLTFRRGAQGKMAQVCTALQPVERPASNKSAA